MQDKYENLLERTVLAMEKHNAILDGQKEISNKIASISEKMDKNINVLNDNFILHSETSDKDRQLIKDEMMKWIKWLAILSFLAVGGSAVLTKFIELQPIL